MWKLTNMAAGMARLPLAPDTAAQLFGLCFLLTAVSGQDNSSYQLPVNTTESYQTAVYTTQLWDGKLPEVTGHVASIQPTASSTLLEGSTQTITLNKTLQTQGKESPTGGKMNPATSVPPSQNVSLYDSESSIISTRPSIQYKLASVYKLDSDTPSKSLPHVPMTSSFIVGGYQSIVSPAKTVTMEPTSLTQPYLYVPSESSGQYSPLSDGFVGGTSRSVHSSDIWSDYQTGDIYPSHYDASTSLPEASLPTMRLPTGYPTQSSAPYTTHIMGTSDQQSIMSTPSIQEVTQTEPLGTTEFVLQGLTSSQLSVSESPSSSSISTVVPAYPSESVADSVFTPESQVTHSMAYSTVRYNDSTAYLSASSTQSTSVLTWPEFLNATSDSPPFHVPISDTAAVSLPSTSVVASHIPSVQYPTPIMSPSVTSQTAVEIGLSTYPASQEPTMIPTQTKQSVTEDMYDTTDVVYLTPSYITEYDEFPSTWPAFPTESYYTDYYYEDTSTPHYVRDQTEHLSQMQPSSAESVTSTVEFVETPVSVVDEVTQSTDRVSETVFPLSPTIQVMSSSVHTTEPPTSMTLETSSEPPYVTTVVALPEYTNQKYVLTFNGDCQPLVSDMDKVQEFQTKVKIILLDYLNLDKDSLYMDRVACGSVKSYVLIYNASQNYSTDMSDLVSSGTFLVQMTFPDTNSSQTFRAYKVEEVDFTGPGTSGPGGKPGQQHLGEKDIILIALACVICAVLIIIGIVVCARHMYSKKYAQSFNLMDTRHANVKMDDYTLTQFPLPRRSYGEDGIRVQSYSHYQTNGQALLAPLHHNYNNHNQSSDLDSTLERSVDVGDVRLEGNKPSSFGPKTRTFDFTANGNHLSGKGDPDIPLPSTSMDSSSSTHDRSTENLVPGLNGSALHGSVNPIYSGDDTEGTASVTSDPPPYTDDNPVNM